MEMTRFAVQRCIGNTIEVLGMYEGKEEMLRALEELRCQYDGQPGGINGISGELDEKGHILSGTMYRIY